MRLALDKTGQALGLCQWAKKSTVFGTDDMITALWQLEVLGRASGKTSSNGLQETSTLHTFFNKWNLQIKCLRNM